jgi:CRISPR type III-B/RAMP module RAMP protein Cmr6
MARIPITGDVADLIGPAAERVENRSLLLDKFAFHKDWGLDEFRANDAHRWTLMRLSDGGAAVLNAEAARRRGQANGRNVEEHNRARLLHEADLAARLAATRIEAEDAQKLRTRHTRRFLGLFRHAYGERALILVGQLEGRLAINLAGSLIQNAGICLDRLFGLPFIPGSAVKGACRHVALEQLRASKRDERQQLFDQFRAVFGTADNDFHPAQGRRPAGDLFDYLSQLGVRSLNQKGAISFLPAYPVNEARVVVDLTNVHYPLYYGGDRRRGIAPGDKKLLAEEKPQPNPFPAVEVGTQLAFCLVFNGVADKASILESARQWLETALSVRGLGAKTAAGYGWFSIQQGVLDRIEREARREVEAAASKAKAEADAKSLAEKEAMRKATLSPEDREVDQLLTLNDEAFANVAKNLADKPEVQQRALLRLLRDNKEKRDRWKTWKKKKPNMTAAIEAVRQKLNAPPLP